MTAWHSHNAGAVVEQPLEELAQLSADRAATTTRAAAPRWWSPAVRASSRSHLRTCLQLSATVLGGVEERTRLPVGTGGAKRHRSRDQCFETAHGHSAESPELFPWWVQPHLPACTQSPATTTGMMVAVAPVTIAMSELHGTDQTFRRYVNQLSRVIHCLFSRVRSIQQSVPRLGGDDAGNVSLLSRGRKPPPIRDPVAPALLRPGILSPRITNVPRDEPPPPSPSAPSPHDALRASAPRTGPALGINATAVTTLGGRTPNRTSGRRVPNCRFPSRRDRHIHPWCVTERFPPLLPPRLPRPRRARGGAIALIGPGRAVARLDHTRPWTENGGAERGSPARPDRPWIGMRRNHMVGARPRGDSRPSYRSSKGVRHPLTPTAFAAVREDPYGGAGGRVAGPTSSWVWQGPVVRERRTRSEPISREWHTLRHLN